MPRLSRRVGTFTESVIRLMTRISDDCPGSINLSQGFPDFDPPAAITDALARAAKEGPHQYSITFGAENVRQAIAKKYAAAWGRPVDPENEIVVTCGSTEAMMCAMMTVCDPGDRVIVFSPFYENYGADAILSGAEPIYVPLRFPDWSFDRAALEDAFRQHPKAIVLCNPSNPCGKVFTRSELDCIAALAQQYDVFVLTDEVYEHIVYAPNVHVSVASLPGMYERTITCNSLSKTYSITGWRLGFLIAPAAVAAGARKVHDFLTVGAPAPLQEAACAGLRFGADYYDAFTRMYTEKRDRFCRGLEALGFRFSWPQGTYYVLVDIGEFLALPRFAGKSDFDFCEWMIRTVGVAAVPGSSFFRDGGENLIRLHFARENATLDEALRRLSRVRALAR